MRLTQITEAKHISTPNEFLRRCAQNVAGTMMAHYFNHNVVTDGWELGLDDFSDKELEKASKIDLRSPEFKQLVIQAVSEEIKNV
jgi:hypothetical protein